MGVFLAEYDYYILGVISLINLLIWVTKTEVQFTWKVNLIVIILFGFVLPYLSALLERNRVFDENEMVDGFNLLYLFFRWPTYWSIGFFEFAFLKIRSYYLKD